MSNEVETDHVVFDTGLARTLLAFLGTAAHEERGGVLLGYRQERKVRVAAAIFPPQLRSAPDNCAFDTQAIDVIRTASRSLGKSSRLHRSTQRVVGWVHTHPRIGLYLSQTDVTTLATWTQLDPATIAVVVDPFKPGGELDQIAWWTRLREGEPSVDGPRVTGGRSIDAGKPTKRDTLTSSDAASLAVAIRTEAGGGMWEIVTAECAISVFPRAAAAMEAA